MKEFIAFNAKQLVDYPDRVSIEETKPDEHTIEDTLTVDKGDIGKVNGVCEDCNPSVVKNVLENGKKFEESINYILPNDSLKLIRGRIKESRVIDWYYKAQTYVDIGWGEASWWNSSLVELMAVLYILEKIGIVVVRETVVFVLIGAFVGFFLLGVLLKAIGIYDRSVYVDAEIDPAQKEILEAARLITKYLNNKNDKILI